MRHCRAALLILLAATRAGPAVADMGGVPLPAGTVAASHEMAVQAGQQMLDAGGSATDAAIAAQMMLSVVSPQDSGLGGGGAMLQFDALTRRVTAWTGREAAPAGEPATRPPAPPHGGRSVGVPGLAAMLEAAHRQNGRLPWPNLLAPAIQAAEGGVHVSSDLARAIVDHQDMLRQRPGARAVFFDTAGSPLAAGATMVNVELAQTLRAIAANGAAALMRGPVAADVATAVRTAAEPGLLTADDLAAYSPASSPGLCEAFGNGMVCAAPAPFAAPQLAGGLDGAGHGPADPRAIASVAVIDGHGNAVSLAASLGQPFGAGLLVRGFLLNNALADFPVTGPDALRPGTQPPSPLAPAMVLDDDGQLIGALAGLQPDGRLAQAIAGLLDPHAGDASAAGPASLSGLLPVIAIPPGFSPSKTQDALVNAH